MLGLLVNMMRCGIRTGAIGVFNVYALIWGIKDVLAIQSVADVELG